MATAPAVKRPSREGAGRKLLPDHLEREERIHLPADEDCPDCGGQLKPLGEDVAEQLEHVRAHFRVIRHSRPTLACACRDRIVPTAAPGRPIDRRSPGPALLAHIAVSKFAYHIPLYRQAAMYSREGVEIDPGAMGVLDGQHHDAVRTAGRRRAPLRAGWREGSCGRHAAASAGAWQWPHEDRTSVGLCE